ncbi:hypothetical protein ABGB12_26130 [Actinocorallia sp. B10E7]
MGGSDLKLQTKVNGGESVYRSFYSAAYDAWGTSGPITKPY